MDLSPSRPSHTSAGTRPTTDFRQLAAATRTSRRRSPWSTSPPLTHNAADLVAPRRRQADPGGQQVGALPGAARATCWPRPGLHGVLAYTLPEALWLAARRRHDDVLVALPDAPTAPRSPRWPPTRAAAAESPSWSTAPTTSTSSTPSRRPAAGPRVRRLPRPRRLLAAGGRAARRRPPLPVHSAAQAAALARAVVARPGFRLVGLMSYEAQIAGVGDAAARPARCAAAAIRRDAAPLGRSCSPSAARPPSRRSASTPTWSSSTAAAPAA